jgi:hypothetical protein
MGIRREVSWIELQLSPEPEGRTRFELEHIAHVDDERWAQFGPGAVGVGWDLGLLGLAVHVGPGGTRDPQEVTAWSASEEGKRFMSLSSERWREASVMAGTDPAKAQEATDQTTTFYTAGDPNVPATS